MSKKPYYLLLSAAFVLFGCHNNNPTTIIKDFQDVAIEGNIVIKGEDDLLISNDIVLLDSLLVIVNLRPSDSKPVFYAYDLLDFEKKHSFGTNGKGPLEFLSPISFRSKPHNNTFCIMDLSLSKMTRISFEKDSIYIESEKVNSNMSSSMNINQVNDSIFYGTKVIGECQGIFFKYNKSTDVLNWIQYISDKESTIKAPRPSELYYNTLLVNREKRIIVTALRFFNKILFFNYEGVLLEEIQIGEKELYPSWDNKNDFISESSQLFFFDMAITDKYIYCLLEEETGEEMLTSKILIFDWNFTYLKTLTLDDAIYRLSVSPDDSFILAIADDGTGLTNIIKYDISTILN